MPIDRINLLTYLRACYQHGAGQARGEARYRKMLGSPSSPLEEAQLRVLLIEADEQVESDAVALRDLDAAEAAMRSSPLPEDFRAKQLELYGKLREGLKRAKP
jgi:hypothetical protein